MVCLGLFIATSQAHGKIVDTLRTDGNEDVAQIEASLNSIATIEQAMRQRIHNYIRLAKGQTKVSHSDQLFAEHLRSTF